MVIIYVLIAWSRGSYLCINCLVTW